MAIPTIKKGNGPKPVRILLVEDNGADVYLLEKTLKSCSLSYELIRYTDGEQAIQALQKDDCAVPDLIILDLNLPRRGGFDVLRRSAENQRWSACPSVFSHPQMRNKTAIASP